VKRGSLRDNHSTSLTAPRRRAFGTMAAVQKQWIDEIQGVMGDKDVAALLRQLDRGERRGGY